MKKINERPIGVFDSGLGGLTVVKEIQRALPFEDIIYFGDTARVPYGNKSKETIKRFTGEIMDFMTKRGVKLVVVACNTASSLALSFLKKKYSVPIIGVIRPGVNEAVKYSKRKRIGVIGTDSTISSGAYERALSRKAGAHKIFTKSCPLFVPLVENKFINDPVTSRVARRYLNGLKKTGIDVLILGCTHYPILKKVIGKVMGKVVIVNSASAVAKEVEKVMREKSINSGRRASGRIKYFVSDAADGFNRDAGIFLKETVKARKVVL